MRILFTLLVVALGRYGYAQESQSKVDSLILGSWELGNSADMKMLRSSGNDIFLKQEITFGLRRHYAVKGYNTNWEWAYNEVTGFVTLADMEAMETLEYLLKSVSEKELVFLLNGTQEIVYKRKP